MELEDKAKAGNAVEELSEDANELNDENLEDVAGGKRMPAIRRPASKAKGVDGGSK